MNYCKNNMLSGHRINILVIFLKYISNIFVDGIIIANIASLFIYFNFHTDVKELVKSSVVFIIVFLIFALVHWFKSDKSKFNC